MARRITSARDQVDMLSPWRLAADDLPYNQWPQERKDEHINEVTRQFNEQSNKRWGDSSKIYRGLQVDLPPELEAHIGENFEKDVPFSLEEMGGHLSIGPKLLDHLQSAHPDVLNPNIADNSKLGLGRHWSTNKSFAEKASTQGAVTHKGEPSKGRWRVVLEADRPDRKYLDPNHTGVGGYSTPVPGKQIWPGEEEDTVLPGSPLNITGVRLEGKEVLHDLRLEKEMPEEYGLPYPGGPQVRHAALQQRPTRPGESPPAYRDIWERPSGLGADFDPFDDFDPHDDEGRYARLAERADDFEWERSFDGGGGWELITHTPDGNPVEVETEPAHGQRSHSRTAGPRRRFNQDWQHIGGDYFPVDVISHYMQRQEQGFGDEKAPLYEMTGRPPLSQQITEHGYEKPVELVTDGKSGSIYDGHHRIDIAKQLGHTHVPVTVSWRNSTGYDGEGAYEAKTEPWLKKWLTDMRGGRETVGRLASLTDDRHTAGMVDETDDDDYRMKHRSPGPGAIPIHDMTGSNSEGGVPEDWYTHPHYYTSGEVSPREQKSTQALYNRVRGNPEAPVNVYRALPGGHTHFNTGDWVTPSLEYARQHAVQDDDPSNDWPVIKTTVPAKHLWQDGNSYYEMGYHGPATPGAPS